jgi:hypothetical protein
MMQPVLTEGAPRTRLLARSRRRKQLAISVHFPVWPDWRDSIRILLRRARHITRVGISAGSPDWTFYRSSHDRDAWSDAQRAQSEDILEIAVEEFGEREICSTAVLDVLAPRYLQKQPECAAIDIRGHHSEKTVCMTALSEGEYGRRLTDAFQALAAITSADSLAVTNLHYGGHCYCGRCRARFHGHTWRSDWPRLPNGAVDTLHSSISKWRSAQLAGVVSRLSAIARANGKQMLFEARLIRDDSGAELERLRSYVDEFIVRDDLALTGQEPVESAAAARDLSRTWGPDGYWHCVGLRDGDGHALAAPRMRLSLASAARGGARRLWVAPSHYLSPLHWQQLDELMSRDDVATAGVD